MFFDRCVTFLWYQSASSIPHIHFLFSVLGLNNLLHTLIINHNIHIGHFCIYSDVYYLNSIFWFYLKVSLYHLHAGNIHVITELTQTYFTVKGITTETVLLKLIFILYYICEPQSLTTHYLIICPNAYFYAFHCSSNYKDLAMTLYKPVLERVSQTLISSGCVMFHIVYLEEFTGNKCNYGSNQCHACMSLTTVCNAHPSAHGIGESLFNGVVSSVTCSSSFPPGITCIFS